MALLLFLVCAAVSSIVLAAATASVGQFANAGQADQRYYSVTSAAQLFRASLNGGVPTGVEGGGAGAGTGAEGAGAYGSAGEDDTLTFVFTQTKVGTQTITRAENGTTVEGDLVPQDKGTRVTFGEPPATKGYDFLSDLTLYALAGKARQTASDADLTAALKTKAADSWDTWLDPFEEGAWASVVASEAGLKTAPDVEYQVRPTLGAAGVADDSLIVKAIARLQSDWTLQLELHNEADVAADQYRLYLALAADVTDNVSVDEELSDSTVDEGTKVTTNTRTVTATKTTVVTWHLGQVVSGRGLLNDE